MDIYLTDYVSGHGDLYLTIDRFAFEPSSNFTAISPANYLPMVIESGNKTKIGNFTTGYQSWIDYQKFVEFTTTKKVDDHAWPDNARIAESFARILNRESRVQLSLDFMIIVISFNFLKVVIMLWVLLTDRSGYLVTLGDAISSFLDRPDPYTVGQCMLDKDDHLSRLGQCAAIDPQTLEYERLQSRLVGTWAPRPLRYSVSLPEDRQNFFVVLQVISPSSHYYSNKQKIPCHRWCERSLPSSQLWSGRLGHCIYRHDANPRGRSSQRVGSELASACSLYVLPWSQQHMHLPGECRRVE
jgi:hypothetical protein